MNLIKIKLEDGQEIEVERKSEFVSFDPKTGAWYGPKPLVEEILRRIRSRIHRDKP